MSTGLELQKIENRARGFEQDNGWTDPVHFRAKIDTCSSRIFTGALWALMLLGYVMDIYWKIATYGSD